MLRLPFGRYVAPTGGITPEQVVPELARSLKLIRPAVSVLWFVAFASELYLAVTHPQMPVFILLALTTMLFLASLTQVQFERAEQEELVERSAAGMRGRLYEDDLTALPNSRHFVAELRRRMVRASRSGRVFALALAHLEGFTPGVVDENQVLPQIGRAIRKAMDDGDFVARLEGMVFVAIVSDGAADSTRDKVEAMRWGIAAIIPPEVADSIAVVTSVTLYAGESEVRDLLRRGQLDLDEARHHAAEAARARAHVLAIQRAADGTPADDNEQVA